MKKYIYTLLMAALTLEYSVAQSFVFNITPTVQIFNGSNTATVSLPSALPGATNYNWTMQALTSSCTPVFSNISPAINGSIISVSFPCCGNFTITCFAFNNTVTPGTPILVSSSNKTVTILCQAVTIHENISTQNELQIFPNPACDRINLQGDQSASIQYALFDSLGRELLKGGFVGVKTLDMHLFGNGSYFIRFDSPSGKTYKKFVLEK